MTSQAAIGEPHKSDAAWKRAPYALLMSTTPRKPAATARSLGTGSRFRDRLGIYLMGVAIGFALLGMLWMARSRATQQNAAAKAVAPPAPTVNNPALAPNATAPR